VNELDILNHTSLAKEKYLEGINLVFTETLAAQLKSKMLEEVKK